MVRVIGQRCDMYVPNGNLACVTLYVRTIEHCVCHLYKIIILHSEDLDN